jgi:hypothetical protein
VSHKYHQPKRVPASLQQSVSTVRLIACPEAVILTRLDPRRCPWATYEYAKLPVVIENPAVVLSILGNLHLYGDDIRTIAVLKHFIEETHLQGQDG